jgi:glycosyltransferase involved in cell wall biosynthesis
MPELILQCVLRRLWHAGSMPVAPDAIHLATEGPLGWAARSYCIKRALAFTTAYHTRFPEILKAALKVPLWMGYALFRHFHKHSSGVLVPTHSVLKILQAKGFRNLRNWTHGVDMQLFTYCEVPQPYAPLGQLARPISLFVGRVSYEKNIEAFLTLDIPGTKIVCGVGPLEEGLRQRFPKAHWLGVLPRDVLAQVYASADVFVMPSRSETFGLVMLEAMATGTPVAAYPVDGPLEVVGSPPAGGVLDDDLARAWPDLLDRDHSILAFNERVLDWAVREDVPLLERLRYLCIVSSNLDEFFEVRAEPHLPRKQAEERKGLFSVGSFERLMAATVHVAWWIGNTRLYNEKLMPAFEREGIKVISHGERNAAHSATGSSSISSGKCARC